MSSAERERFARSEKSNTTGDKLRYLHKDHLGSVMAYSDEAGHMVQELSYDAWGRRRDPANWDYYPALTDANAWHPIGFTGQEHLDLFEMVNMDGRMYDPVLGRFMSADPYVQAPDYSQSLNRYAYCLNNPLSLMDPSGYSWFSKHWKSLLSATVGIAVTIVSGGLGSIVLAGALGRGCCRTLRSVTKWCQFRTDSQIDLYRGFLGLSGRLPGECFRE